jgi:hypothetical protein
MMKVNPKNIITNDIVENSVVTYSCNTSYIPY